MLSRIVKAIGSSYGCSRPPCGSTTGWYQDETTLCVSLVSGRLVVICWHLWCMCHICQHIVWHIRHIWRICGQIYAHIVHISTHTDICVFRVAVSLVGACPVGWLFYETTLACFYMSTATMSQTAAYAECRSMGAELASFSDQAEMDFVTSVSSVPTSFSISLLYFRRTSDETTVKELDTATFVWLGINADIPPRKTFDTVKSNRATGRSNNVDLWTHTHTHTRLTALFPGLPRWAGTRRVKPIWILLKQETVSGSGFSWTMCKSAPRSRQITTPTPHHSVVYRPDALIFV